MVTDFELEEGIIKILGSRETHKIISNFSFLLTWLKHSPFDHPTPLKAQTNEQQVAGHYDRPNIF